MKKVTGYMLFGIPSGILIGLITSLIFSWQAGYGIFYPGPPAFMSLFNNELEALTAALVLWSIVGMMFSISSLIFEKLEWSILKQTSLHFLCTYTGLLALNVFLNWFDYTLGNVAEFTLTFMIIYAVVWSVSMIRVKKSLDQINQRLKKEREKR